MVILFGAKSFDHPGFEQRSGSSVACLFLDIDYFKSINDSLGHAAGDEALREFSKRLQSCVRQTDTVARLAGDEFVIALDGIEDSAIAESLAEKIIETMRAPFRIALAELSVSTGIGLAVSSAMDHVRDDLLK